MNIEGIQLYLAAHAAKDRHRRVMRELMAELWERLRECCPTPNTASIWSAQIEPWGNFQGYDIRLRTPGNSEILTGVKKVIEERLAITFKDFHGGDHSPSYEANWKENVRVYLGT